MDNEVIARVLTTYGVDYVRLLPLQKGYRNESHAVELASGRLLNLIMYKSEPGMRGRIQNANRVADYLATHGLPARQTADPRVIQLRSATGAIKYGALYEYLPGRTIPWEAYTRAHIKLLGKTMGDMHAMLQHVSADTLPEVADEYIAIVSRMRTYFSDPNVRRAMQHKLGMTIEPTLLDEQFRVLAHCKQLPGQQALHMDFVRGNILFDGSGQISGVLDFEKTAKGHPLFDIARTYAFLLVDCKYKTPRDVRKYFLQSGYGKHGRSPFKLNEYNERLLQKLTELFLLYDFYKFLRHNPYEYLHQNEHYVRTCTLLGLSVSGLGS